MVDFAKPPPMVLVKLHTSLHGPPAADGMYSQNPTNSLLTFKH